MKSINVEWEDNPKTPTEEIFKQEKAEKLAEQEAEEQGAEEQEAEEQEPEEQEAEPLLEEGHGLEDIIIVAYDKIAEAKNLEPMNDKDIEYLHKHFARLNAKYGGKASALASPEVEAGLSLAMTLAQKLIATYVKKPQNSGGVPNATQA